MKVINLIPQQIILDRTKTTLKKSSLYLLTVPVLITLGLNYQSMNLSSQITNSKSLLTDITSTIAQITEVNKEIDLVNSQKDIFKGSDIPLNHFLYFLSTNATDDIKIVSIKANTSSKAEVPIVDPTTEGQTDTTEEEINTNELTNPIDGLTSDAEDSPQNDTTEISPETTVENTGNSETQNIDKTITIVGYSLYPDSIASLIEKIRENSYIKEVKATKIDNYYTGKMNLKIFEIKIIKRGE